MSAIEKLPQLDWLLVILGFFAILFAAKEVIEILTYFKNKFRIKNGIESDKENIEERIAALEANDAWQREEISKISDGIRNIKETLLDSEIDTIRWELLDFCSALIGGRKYNREAYEHIFKTYEKYERILKENNMTNGYVDESMKVIKEIYHERLVNNDFL